jgi:hypothetical protein
MDVSLRRWPDAPPPATEQHEIVAVCVSDADADPFEDPRLSITFTTSDNRVLRIRLPISEVQSLADVLQRLAYEREWQQ